MNRITSRCGMAALGLGMAIAMSAGIQASSAQPGPRVLPSSPQYQDQAPEQQQDRQFDRDYGQDGRDANRFVRPGERLERRLEFLHGELRITPAQERAWQIFTNVLRDEARDRMRDRREYFGDRRDDIRAPSVLDRLEERHQRLADRTADLERVMRALRPLYASFSADQRRTADRLMFRPERGRGFGDRRFGGPGFERGGPPERDRDEGRDRDYRPGDYR